ncbi:DUF4124 domain-containing protein [Pseudomonas sp. 5P_3.1_Bac2]|uniref:DUF4124 domain-containing protein n=1 Tax=Pseudomonas sp. 5P_3.1_Bac2 TaxID=2971617 RepID=UPI0021C61FC7|nr:DUF4124 domain-containing protein [Pseudomonas sp. 5P_3.1_Bac2]MCU1718839.1 DUF4124 domain-containing protein [Pseudomonas sp. 5P_3.1_Bac2]
MVKQGVWLLLLPSLAFGEIYRWVDSSGQVHFEQRPSAGAQKVEVKPQVVERDELTIEREARTQRLYDARRQEQAQANAELQAQQAKQQQACQELRRRLANLPEGVSFYKEQADGQRSYYSDQQVDAARADLKQRISEQCS